jgi:hypothetical protein
MGTKTQYVKYKATQAIIKASALQRKNIKALNISKHHCDVSLTLQISSGAPLTISYNFNTNPVDLSPPPFGAAAMVTAA